MEIVISFLVTVAAGVTCHLICKWLDRHDRDNKQPSGRSTTEIKREEPSNVLAVHPGARSLFTWNIVISFLPTGIIAYADQEINMQVILKQIKKSKLSPWFMPYFSKMAQLIGLLSVVGVHPWLLLVLQCLTLSDILTTSQKRVQGCFLARDIFYEDMFSYI